MLFIVRSLILSLLLITSLKGERFVNPTGDYSVEFPSNWEIIKGQMGVDVVAVVPFLAPGDLFHENVNIISAEFEIPISLEEFYSYNINSLTDLMVDFDLEENKDVKLDGVNAKKIVFTHRLGVVNVKVVQYLILVNKRAYLMSFTSDTLEYPKVKDQFEAIAASFKFEKK